MAGDAAERPGAEATRGESKRAGFAATDADAGSEAAVPRARGFMDAGRRGTARLG